MMTTFKKTEKTARVKAMDYLARRDHSEKELRDKLSRFYTNEEISQALAELNERGWILPPEELSAKVSQQLHNKGKGIYYINQYLQKKGLPSVPKDPELEFDKAMEICQQKLSDPNDLAKLSSLLKNRGFDTETLSQVVHEIRRNSQSFY